MLGLIGIYIVYWGVKNTVLYSFALSNFLNENPNYTYDELGAALFHLVKYIVTFLLGLVVVYLAFHKKRK